MEHPLAVVFVRWIVLLPLLGAAVNFLAGAHLQRELGKRAISFVGCGTVVAAFRAGAIRRVHDDRGGARRSLHARPSLAMDLRWPAAARHRVLARPTLDADGADHHRRRRPDSHLFDRLHARGRILLALLRVAQPVHVRDAGAGAGGQPVADVRRLGGRGAVLVRADRLLVQGPREHHRRQQGLYRQPRWRLGVRGRAVFVIHRAWRGRPSDLGHPRRRALGTCAGWYARLLRDVASHVRDAAAVRGRDRQVGADSAARMAA